MALRTVEGVYHDGKVELDEIPAGIGPRARVVVTFLPDEPPKSTETPAAINPVDLRERAFDRMEKGLNLGGGPYPKRDELYDRFDR